MLFNSAAFAVFFPVVTALYFLLPFRARTPLLLAASAVFYACFIPKYLLILAALILVDYVAGRVIEPARGSRRRLWLIASIAANLGMLFCFKYWNFAADSLARLAGAVHLGAPLPLLDLALPIGLSFHTFQSLAYTIDVYRGQVRAERNLATYALYVMFYPQLVAGPIERPQHLLPQLKQHHRYRHADAASGLRLITWGLLKKIVIADRLALFVNDVYGDPFSKTGPALSLASVFFAYQIYCDFSGYSDIAIGAARVMGIRLVQNFDAPYLATSVGDFWRRWHISLSTWFRDYVYIPLGGSRVSDVRRAGNIMLTFLLSGLWHGASWNFVVWGALHGAYVVAGNAVAAKWPQGVPRVVGRAITFTLVCFAWIFFRAADLDQALWIATHLTAGWPAIGPDFVTLVGRAVSGAGLTNAGLGLAAVSILILEVSDRLLAGRSFDDRIQSLAPVPRWTLYYATLLAILTLGRFDASQFIYFQF